MDDWELVTDPEAESFPVEAAITHFYIVWKVEGHPELGSTIYCATARRGWGQFVRLLPERKYSRTTCRLRRAESLEAALAPYRAEVTLHGSDVCPRIRYC